MNTEEDKQNPGGSAFADATLTATRHLGASLADVGSLGSGPGQNAPPPPTQNVAAIAPKPTVGRRVWYWSDDDDAPHTTIISRRTPFDAGVVFVHEDGRVNLDVADHHGKHHARLSVTLVMPGAVEAAHGHGIAQWMPVQTTPAYQNRGPA